MKAAKLYRWAGMVGVVAGGLNIIVEFLPDRSGGPLNLLVVTLSLWALTGLYLRQREASGTLGAIGYVMNSFGLALVVGLVFTEVFVLAELEADPVEEMLAGTAGLVALASLVIFTLGTTLFGLATIRAGIFPKWAAGLYIVGFLPVPVAPFIADIFVSVGELAASIGLIWLSYTLILSVGETE